MNRVEEKRWRSGGEGVKGEGKIGDDKCVGGEMKGCRTPGPGTGVCACEVERASPRTSEHHGGHLGVG